METLIRVKITSGHDTGREVLKSYDRESKLVTGTYDLDGDQINDLGNHEWQEIEELGQYDAEDTDAFWALVAELEQE